MLYGNYKKREKLFTRVYYVATIFAFLVLLLDLLGLVRLQPLLSQALVCAMWVAFCIVLVPTIVDMFREPDEVDKLLGFYTAATYLFAGAMSFFDLFSVLIEQRELFFLRDGIWYGMAKIVLIIVPFVFIEIGLSRAKRREGTQS